MLNIDPKTGIHYGVIPKNDLFNCAEEFFDNADDLSYREAINKLKEDIQVAVMEQLQDLNIEESDIDFSSVFDSIEEKFNDQYYSDCANMRYEQDGFILESNNDDPDLFVIKSPYYTFAPPCSPCAPGAGYLRDAAPHVIPEDSTERYHSYQTYCLPKDWFEDGKCPYVYWKVEAQCSKKK